MSTRVLIVKGTTAHKSRLASVAEIAHEAAEQTGGDVHVWAPRDKCSWTTEQLCEHSRLLDRKGPSA